MPFNVSFRIKKFEPYLDSPSREALNYLPDDLSYSRIYSGETLEYVRKGKERGWINDDDELKPEVHFYLSDMNSMTSRESYIVANYNDFNYSKEKNILLKYHKNNGGIPTSLILCVKVYVLSLKYSERKSIPGAMQTYKKTAGFAWISLHHLWKEVSANKESSIVKADLYEFITYKKVLKGHIQLEFDNESFSRKVEWIPSTGRPEAGSESNSAFKVAESVQKKMEEMVMSGVGSYSKITKNSEPPFSPVYERIVRIHAPTSTTDFFFAITSLFTLVLPAFLPKEEYLIHHMKIVLRREDWTVEYFNDTVRNQMENRSNTKGKTMFHAACAIVIAACSLFASSTLYRSDYIPTSGRRRRSGKEREIGEDYGYIEETFAGDCEDSAAANYRAIMMMIMTDPDRIDTRKGADYEMLVNAIHVARLYVPVLTLMEVTNPSFDKNAYKEMFKKKNYNAFPPMCHTVCIAIPRKAFFDAIRKGSNTNETFTSEKAFFGGRYFPWERDLHVLVSEGTAPTWPQQIPAAFYYGKKHEPQIPIHARYQEKMRVFRSEVDRRMEAFRLFKMTMLPDNYQWNAEGLDKRDLFYKQTLSRFYLTAVECYTGYPLIVSKGYPVRLAGDNFTEFLIVNPEKKTYGVAFSDLLLMGRSDIKGSGETTSNIGLYIKRRFNNEDLKAIERMMAMEIPLSTLELGEDVSERRKVEGRLSLLMASFNGKGAITEKEALVGLRKGIYHRATWYVAMSDFSALEETVKSFDKMELSKLKKKLSIVRMDAKYVHIARNPHDKKLLMNQIDVDLYFAAQ